MRYCVIDGYWELCPGGGGEPCPRVSGPLSFRGRDLNTVEKVVPLTSGRWRADICLWDSPFGASVLSVVMLADDNNRVIRVNGRSTGLLFGRDEVAEGMWSVEFETIDTTAHLTKILLVTATGGGEWTVVFTRLDGPDDTG